MRWTIFLASTSAEGRKEGKGREERKRGKEGEGKKGR
jgi:hypothetical protein